LGGAADVAEVWVRYINGRSATVTPT
jgi:hypothetical protein